MKHVDALTGLENREAFQQRLDEQIGEGGNVAVAAIDIDYFVEINSEFGHYVGDQVLITLSAILREFQPDGAFRISGDEFAVIFPGLSLEQAFLRVEGLRAAVHGDAARFGLPDGRSLTITAGVAQYPRDAKDVRSLMKAADAALMAAKETGRNQVALPPNEEMVMKSCYYPAGAIRRLKALAETLQRKESALLREALDDLLRKYDIPREG